MKFIDILKSMATEMFNFFVIIVDVAEGYVIANLDIVANLWKAYDTTRNLY